MSSANPYLRESTFKPSASGSGLIVPDALSRTRQVWTHDESRLHDRFVKLMEARGLKIKMACGTCKTHIERMRNQDGSITLQCDCTDRIFMRAY